MIQTDQYEDLESYHKLLPQAVESARHLLGFPRNTEAEDELLSVATWMLVEQYPNLSKHVIKKYLPFRLMEWWLDNSQAFVGVKAAANRTRRSRGKDPEYVRQNNDVDINVLSFTQGKYAPEIFHNVTDKEIAQVHKFFDILYDFVAEDKIDRDIIDFYRQQFDPNHIEIFLELEKLSHKKIAASVGVSRATVSRRLAAMKKRIPKSAV